MLFFCLTRTDWSKQPTKYPPDRLQIVDLNITFFRVMYVTQLVLWTKCIMYSWSCHLGSEGNIVIGFHCHLYHHYYWHVIFIICYTNTVIRISLIFLFNFVINFKCLTSYTMCFTFLHNKMLIEFCLDNIIKALLKKGCINLYFYHLFR